MSFFEHDFGPSSSQLAGHISDKSKGSYTSWSSMFPFRSLTSAKTLFFSISIMALVLACAQNPQHAHEPGCERGLASDELGLCKSVVNPQAPEPTRLEKLLPPSAPPLNAKEQLTEAIEGLRKESPELAREAVEARRLKDRGGSLKIDLSPLPTFMVYFLEGAFRNVVGPRGLSKPFTEIKAVDQKTLVVHHVGDVYPLMIRWSEEVSEIKSATELNENGVTYRLLQLPSTLTSQRDLRNLPDKYIYSLISASRFNRFILSSGSAVALVASLLHDEKASTDRPTQTDFKTLRLLFDTDTELRKNVRSLLFVAPTASGKTRILVEGALAKIKSTQAQILVSNFFRKKLTILMTRTPDLTGVLAQEVGTQLYAQLGSKNVRLIQWGGENSEPGKLDDLIKFVQNSDTPVVLFTNYPTLAARITSDSEMERMFDVANGLLIDETHNSGGVTFTRALEAAERVATHDRTQGDILNSLDILGVTASPINRVQRTIELFDYTFWASTDSPGSFARAVKTGSKKPWDGLYKDSLEWRRIKEQYQNAREQGEINAPDQSVFYIPEEHGFAIGSLFKRASKGTQSSVDIEKLKVVWPDVAEMIKGHGPGVIQTYPRDADIIAQALSQLTGKNYVSLQKLNIGARAQVYEAFKNQTPYNGKTIDAIVGTIREGLDFPKAGWYLSFKKYVKFPENIQGPGRVVRLGFDKLPPVIIFFGVEINRIAYQDVRDLIMMKMGRLPRALPTGRLYSGARRGRPGQPLTKAVEDLNVSIEALIRIKTDVAKNLGDIEHPNPETIISLQETLRKTRHSGANREIALSMDRFVFEVNSYPFFQGDLQSTWAYCNRILAAAKSAADGKPYSKNLSINDIDILKDPAQLDRVKEFREMYAWLGSVPRALLQNMSLKPNNLYELAEAVNVFVARNAKLPYNISEDPKSLPKELNDALSASRDAFIGRLNFQARTAILSRNPVSPTDSFETTLNQYYKAHSNIPRLSYEFSSSVDQDVDDGNEQKMALRLNQYIKDGTLDIASLDRGLLKSIDSSDDYKELNESVLIAIADLKASLKTEYGSDPRLKDSSLLGYDTLMKYQEFAMLRVIRKLAALRLGRSIIYTKQIESALAQ
jgi:superfamily II DNA or RNA helicase